jgi:type IX secretion system PorP/SprF family membrane protein
MRKITTIFALIGSLHSFAQQDVHFSMWQATPSILNPAAVGAMNEDFNFFVNNRTQWLTALTQPFLTSTFNGELRIAKEKLTSGWFGLGLQANHDLTGRATNQTISGGIPISYNMEVSRNSLLSIGMRPGVIYRTLNKSFQTWDNQWNGIAFDQTYNTSEPNARNFAEFDLNAGMFYQTITQNDSKFNIGFSMNHINRPNVTQKEIIDELEPQYMVHTGARIKFQKYRFRLSPQVTAFKQGPILFLMGGSNLDLVLREGSRRTVFVQERLVSFGLHYKNSGFATANFGITLENFSVGLAYDAPINSSREVTGLFGAGEIFMKYAFVKGERRMKLR